MEHKLKLFVWQLHPIDGVLRGVDSSVYFEHAVSPQVYDIEAGRVWQKWGWL